MVLECFGRVFPEQRKLSTRQSNQRGGHNLCGYMKASKYTDISKRMGLGSSLEPKYGR